MFSLFKSKDFWALAFPVLLLIAIIGVAFAAGSTATVGWTAPTVHTDGTPLVANEITGFKVTAVAKNYVATLTANAPATAPGALTTGFLLPGLICGSFDISVQAVTATSTSDPGAAPTYATGLTCSVKSNPPTAVTAK